MIEQTINNGKTVTLRRVQTADNPFLFDLYASTRADEMALVQWVDEKKQAFLKMQFSAQLTSYEENFPQAMHDIIEIDCERVGRLYVDRFGGEIRLLDITVLPEYRNRGIGSTLLRQLQEESKRSGKPIRFYVWQLNHGAQRFYLRHGCKQIDEEGAYIFMEWLPLTAKSEPAKQKEIVHPVMEGEYV